MPARRLPSGLRARASSNVSRSECPPFPQLHKIINFQFPCIRLRSFVRSALSDHIGRSIHCEIENYVESASVSQSVGRGRRSGKRFGQLRNRFCPAEVRGGRRRRRSLRRERGREEALCSLMTPPFLHCCLLLSSLLLAPSLLLLLRNGLQRHPPGAVLTHRDEDS